jgi:hypothetical protein
MAQAVGSFDYPGPRGQITFGGNEELQSIVDGWPRRFVSEEAGRLGIKADGSFADIIRSYVEDVLQSG